MRLDINNRPLWVQKTILTFMLFIVLAGTVILAMVLGYWLHIVWLKVYHIGFVKNYFFAHR